jgi:hypothetical protein
LPPQAILVSDWLISKKSSILLKESQFIWLSGFRERRLKCEKLTDDGRQTMDDGCQKLTLPLAR